MDYSSRSTSIASPESSGPNIKVIYVDIKSLKFLNPLIQEIIPLAEMKKYTAFYSANFSSELLNKMEIEVKQTTEKLIHVFCNMLLHKVCPSHENIKIQTQEMYQKCLVLFDNFRKDFESKELEEAYYKLLALHTYISEIPETKKFDEKLKEMVNEITNAIKFSQHKEIFCFDVTKEFKAVLETSGNIEEEKEENVKAPQQHFNKNSPQNQSIPKNIKPIYDMHRINPHHSDWEKLCDALEKCFSFLIIALYYAWYMYSIYLLPHLIALFNFFSKKSWKKVKSLKVWRKVKKNLKPNELRKRIKMMNFPDKIKTSSVIFLNFMRGIKTDYIDPQMPDLKAYKLLAIICQIFVVLLILCKNFLLIL